MITYKELISLIEGKTSASQRRRNQRGFSHNEIKSEYSDRPSLVVSVKKVRKNQKEQEKEDDRIAKDSALKEDIEFNKLISEEELDSFLEEVLAEELYLESNMNIKARHDVALRFKKSEQSRERATKLALSHKADEATIEHRARKMAVMLMKKKLAKKSLDKLSVQEKEHLEDLIKKKHIIVDKLAAKLKQKLLKLERKRLEK